MAKQVLVTVGTTLFEGLIKSTDRQQLVDLLNQRGYNKIVYQIGKGVYEPKHGQNFRLTPHINQYYNKADLIITHGGAGTLLQNLHNCKLIIAVANDQLLGNHQVELIQQLSKQGYILGFKSIQQFQNGFQLIKQFIIKGPSKLYKRPETCIMNQLIFGPNKDKKQ